MPAPHHLTIVGTSVAIASVAIGVAVMVLQAIVFFRDLDQRWRSCCLALSPIPLLLGVVEFGTGFRQIAFPRTGGPMDMDSVRTFLLAMEGILLPLVVSALVTVLLLAGMVGLHLPVRQRRPGTVGIIWSASVAMVALTFLGQGIIGIRSHSGVAAFHSTSPAAYVTEGPVTVFYGLLTGHVAEWFIPLWLVVAGIISCRLHPHYRLRLAYSVFGLAALMLLTSCLVIFKAVVVANPTHPAISGKGWVDILGVHSW
jgi:hypothetical protein